MIELAYLERNPLPVEWPRPPGPPRLAYFLGLDLAELRDFTALTMVERRLHEREAPQFRLRDLVRWPQRTAYAVILKDTVEYLLRRPAAGGAPLVGRDCWAVLDATGVGRAVWQQFRDAPELRDLRQAGRLRAVTITGGQAAAFDVNSGAYNVPKKDIVGCIQATLGTGRLKVAKGLPLADTLRSECDTFTAKVRLSGHESFEAWRERDHDDCVLALGLSLWCALWAPDGGAVEGPAELTPPRTDPTAADPRGPESWDSW
jgi:hypothetical protein